MSDGLVIAYVLGSHLSAFGFVLAACWARFTGNREEATWRLLCALALFGMVTAVQS